MENDNNQQELDIDLADPTSDQEMTEHSETYGERSDRKLQSEHDYSEDDDLAEWLLRHTGPENP